MTNLLTIFSLVLAGIAVSSCFIPRFPAAIASFIALVLVYFGSAAIPLGSQTLIFWGIATIIVVALNYLQPKALTAARQGHAYVTGGTLIGTLLGYLAGPVTAYFIIGSAIGAFLGAWAYMRTPASPHLPITSRPFTQYLCAKGLPAIVSFSMAAIVIACVL